MSMPKPLHLACMKGHESIVSLLLENGAYVNVKAKDGSTPLHCACENRYGKDAVISLLLEKGADPEPVKLANSIVVTSASSSDDDMDVDNFNAELVTLGGSSFVDVDDDPISSWKLAAGEGDITAMINLAVCYRIGKMVVQDCAEAFKWFKMVAEKGNPEAMYRLGDCYWKGQGVEQDNAEAVKWFCMAGEKGNTEAMKNLAHVHTSGDVMEQDPIELCKMAAEEGDTNAMITLADCYKDGDGVESNDDQAIKWLHVAADNGNPNAMERLGMWYFNGICTDQDYELAFKHYKRAAELIHNKTGICRLNVAMFYLSGCGVQRSIEQAKHWITKALEFDDEEPLVLILQADILASSLKLEDLKNAKEIALRVPDEEYLQWLLPFIDDQIQLVHHNFRLPSLQLDIDFKEESELRPVALIGKGCFGKVYLSWYRNRFVAIKILSANLIQEEREVVRNVMRERFICRLIESRNFPDFVDYIGFIDDFEHEIRGLIFELCADIEKVKDEAMQFVKEKARTLPETELDKLPNWSSKVMSNLRQAVAFAVNPPRIQVVVRILREVAEALNHLHEIGILHRDIAARNILCNKDLNVKLADFGLSKVVGVPEANDLVAEYYKKKHRDTIPYPAMAMAPEALGEPAIYSSASDVWSFGMLMYQCIAHKDPYEDLLPSTESDEVSEKAVASLIVRIKNGALPNIQSRVRKRVPEGIIDLMEDCWKMEPDDRPTMPEIIERLWAVESGTFKPSKKTILCAETAVVKWSDVRNKYAKLSATELEELVVASTENRQVKVKYTYEQWRHQLSLVGHKIAPSTTIDQSLLSPSLNSPFDVFLIHTGAQKALAVTSMKHMFESRGFRTFVDKEDIAFPKGRLVKQMQVALETCRYAVAIISREFMEKDDSCDELQYACRRMKWIREMHQWESLYIVLFDLSVEEFEKLRKEKCPTLLKLSKEIRMRLFDEGRGVFDTFPHLSNAVKADLYNIDTEEGGIEKWISFLQEWSKNREKNSVLRADSLYSTRDEARTIESE